jgi:biotin-(acetyl-CoA carboxylase) ligase
VIGIGINVNQQIFPPELSNPVSLWQIIGSVQDRDYILDIFQREFFLLYRDFEKGEIKLLKMNICSICTGKWLLLVRRQEWPVYGEGRRCTPFGSSGVENNRYRRGTEVRV